MEISRNIGFSLVEKNDLCRTCLCGNDDNKSIFTLPVVLDHENYRSLDLWEKLQLYGGIEVAQNDGLPDKMCNECISKMNVAHEFRIQCQRTDEKLRTLYRRSLDENDLISVNWTQENNVITKKEADVGSCDVKMEYLDESLVNTNHFENSPLITTENFKNEIGSNNTEIVKPDFQTELRQSHKHIVIKKLKADNNDESKSISGRSTDAIASQKISENSTNKSSLDPDRANNEKLVSKRESYRSRKLFVFKRATSLENLKNRKERQRQYIKKTVYSKQDENDREAIQIGKNTVNGSINSQVQTAGSVLPFKCLKCCRSFSNKKSLDEHAFNHNNKKFSCDQCDKRFCRLDTFLEHTKLHELKEKLKPASCKICNKNFRKAETMVRHLHVHKRTNPSEVYFILKDMRDKRKEKNFVDLSTEICENNQHSEENVSWISRKDTVSVPDLQNRESERQDIRNLTLGKTNILPASENETSKNKLTNAEPVELPDDKAAIKLINVWIKEELDSDNEGKGFPCKRCTKSYVTRKALMKHEAKIHDNESCKNCVDVCTCIEKMRENDNSEEKSKAHTCDECNKTFEKQVKLEKHMRIHARAREQQDSNFKRFLCHICSKTFRQNTGLMFHMRTHTGYKPHLCKYCGRGFTSNSNCINHERTHTGDRPFICHFCSAAFAKSCTLKAHITTHTGEANYHCKTCGKSFRRLKYLKEHRFTHTGEKPYACKICGTAYSHSGSLFVHEKKCKAQYTNYQTTSTPDSLNYCQSENAETSASSLAPIIITLPSSHNFIPLNNTVISTEANKNSIDNDDKTNVKSVTVSTNSEPSDDSPVSFTIVGQIYQT